MVKPSLSTEGIVYPTSVKSSSSETQYERDHTHTHTDFSIKCNNDRMGWIWLEPELHGSSLLDIRDDGRTATCVLNRKKPSGKTIKIKQTEAQERDKRREA
jgi:hypothetical protein